MKRLYTFIFRKRWVNERAKPSSTKKKANIAIILCVRRNWSEYVSMRAEIFGAFEISGSECRRALTKKCSLMCNVLTG